LTQDSGQSDESTQEYSEGSLGVIGVELHAEAHVLVVGGNEFLVEGLLLLKGRDENFEELLQRGNGEVFATVVVDVHLLHPLVLAYQLLLLLFKLLFFPPIYSAWRFLLFLEIKFAWHRHSLSFSLFSITIVGQRHQMIVIPVEHIPTVGAKVLSQIQRLPRRHPVQQINCVANVYHLEGQVVGILPL
jgi:hypothetical protein